MQPAAVCVPAGPTSTHRPTVVLQLYSVGGGSGVGGGVGIVVQPLEPPIERWPSGHGAHSPFGEQAPAGAVVFLSQVHGSH